MERQKTQNSPRVANTILKEKNKAVALTLFNFRTYHETIVIKTVWYWPKNRQVNQWKRIRSPEIDPINISNWSLTKEQRQYNGEKLVFLTSGAGTTRHPHAKKLNLDTDVISFTKINWKWVKDLNIKCKTIKLTDNAFLDITQKAWFKKKIEKAEFN